MGKRKIRNTSRFKKTVKTIKGLFISCIIFMVCHLPFGLVILSDLDDKLPNIAYMYSMLIAHLGSSTNVILYAFTNTQLFKGYKNFYYFCICRIQPPLHTASAISGTFMDNHS